MNNIAEGSIPAMQVRCDRLWSSARRVAAAMALLSCALLHPAAFAATGAKNFDHMSTGFPLTGQHESARCEDCHVRGIFKGTPAQCAACHTPGALVTAVMIPNNHFPTSQPCSSCHTTATFYGAHFPHSDVAPGSCNTCHNGVFAKGKTPNHIAVADKVSCDMCHTTASFATANLALPTGHIPTLQPCATCHASSAFIPGVMNHTGTAGTCTSCHATATTPYTFTIQGTMVINGVTVTLTRDGLPVTIVPMSQGGLNATKTTGAVNHIPVTASCDDCHTNGIFTPGSAFKGSGMKHAAVAGASCSSCHNVATVFAGTSPGAGGEPVKLPGTAGVPGAGNHIPLGGLDCAASGCHAAKDALTGTGFKTGSVPELSAAGHASITAILSCNSCHSTAMSWFGVANMVSASALHIPPDNVAGSNTVDCRSCHAPTSFGTGQFHLTAVPGAPSATTNTSEMPPASHSAVAGLACASCHEAGKTTFLGVNSNIYLRPGQGAASGISKAVDASHTTGNAATQDCAQCHTVNNFTGIALPSNHIPLNTPRPSCNDCHAGGYAPGTTTMKHADVTQIACATCHYNKTTTYAGSAPGANGQPVQIPGTPGTSGAANHIPLGSLGCSASGCHAATDAMTGTGFKTNVVPELSANGHTSITASVACDACHTINMAWYGVATLVTPGGTHIPPDNAAGTTTVDCKSCHSATSFGTAGFHLSATPDPAGSSTNNSAMPPAAHSSVSGLSCATCHEAGNTGFQGVLGQIYLRPGQGAASGVSQAVDATHTQGNQASQDCVQCHNTNNFISFVLPGNHIPLNTPQPACADCHSAGYASGKTTMKHSDVTQVACAVCHNNKTTTYAGSSQGANGQPWQIPGTPGTAGAANHIPLGGLGCAASGCHAATDVMNGVGFKTNIVPELSAAGHTSITATLACDTCHTNGMAWYGVSTLVAPSAVHIPPDNAAGTTTIDCKPCHSATSFGQGQFHLTAVPGAPGATTNTSEMPPASHTLVGSLSCATCHEAGKTSFQGVLTQIYLRPGQGGSSGISQAVDATHTQGNQATQDCGQCHNINNFSTFALPTNHIPLNTPTPACTDCHSAGYAPGKTTMKHADVSTNCASCHNNPGYAYSGSGQGINGQPVEIPGTVGTSGAANHIPLGGLNCAASGCHTVKDPMTGTGFKTGIVPELSAAGHTSVTATLACDTCHTNGMAWYGVATLVTPSAVHIPPDNTAGTTTIDCKPCHSATSFGQGQFHLTAVPGAAGATTNTSEMPPASHTLVGSLSCATCHEAGQTGFQGVLTQIYLRPGQGAASGISKAVDVPHTTGNQATQDCVQCHSINNFSAVAKPSNHIPLNTPAPACADCHANGYGPGISTMKHADVTQFTCASCHNNKSTTYAGTGPGANGQPVEIPGTPGTSGAANHIPLGGLDCAASGCHAVTDVMNGTGFKTNISPTLSAAGHTSVTASVSCQSCHNIGMAWYGSAALVTPDAGGTHIPPYNTAAGTMSCTGCHSAVYTSWAISGTPGTLTSGNQSTTPNVSKMSVASHANVASVISTCATCHENGKTGFQGIGTSIYLRPAASGGGLSYAADTTHLSGTAQTGDCSQCHSSANFAGNVKPADHIPVVSTAVCTDCHVGGVYTAVNPTAMPHTGYVTGTCASCHNTATVFGGSVFTPNASSPGGTFGTQSGTNFRPRQIVSSPAIGTSGGHIPLVVSGEDCNVCHTSFAAFGPGTAMVHTGISSGCATCHAAGSKWYGETYTASPLVTTGNKTLSPLHVPINQGGNPACEECHSASVFTSFGTATAVNHKSGGFMTYSGTGNTDSPNRALTSTPKCVSCHAPSGTKWYQGTGNSMSSETMGSHHNSQTGDDCEYCHSTGSFNNAAAAAAVARRPVQRSTGGLIVRPTAPGTAGSAGGTPLPFSHLGVSAGGCISCHGPGGTATAKPANHLPTALSCDACHRTSAWLPALFTHNGVVAGTCASCHTGGWATPKPTRHMLTSRTCDTCHHSTTSWTPESYTHMDLIYSPHPATVTCIACHASDTEQVVWKFPSFKPGCAGCHGSQFGGTSVRRSKGPAEGPPRTRP